MSGAAGCAGRVRNFLIANQCNGLVLGPLSGSTKVSSQNLCTSILRVATPLYRLNLRNINLPFPLFYSIGFAQQLKTTTDINLQPRTV